MITPRCCWLAVYILIFPSFAPLAPAQTSSAEEYGDILEFFAAEAQVVTAARQPHSRQHAPATTYVVTREEIHGSGAQTLWDALRAVPGVDVMAVSATQGEVSIRGLNKALNNRTLVLLDGKPVLDRYYDRVSWENIPIGLEEIDRIEVVEGPVSALYGANAINGVVNILTRTPEQLAGGAARLTIGARGAFLGDILYGARRGPLAGKVSLGRRTTNRYQNPDSLSTEVNRLHADLSYRSSAACQLGISGGLTDITSTQILAGLGSAQEVGPGGYLRANLRREEGRLQFIWERNRTHLTHLLGLEDAPDKLGLHHDTYELQAEQTLRLPGSHTLTAGASWRTNRMHSPLLSSGERTRQLHSLYGEDQWQRRWLELVVSARLDRHSLTGWEFSPRGSAIFSPFPRQVFRFSAGTAFRFPTLVENEIQVYRSFVVDNPEGIPVQTRELVLRGSRQLDPERLQMLELAYAVQLGRLQLSAVGFRYWLENVIATTEPELILGQPVSQIHISLENRAGETRTWGGELEARAELTSCWSAFLNYAFQDLDEVLDPLVSTNGGPRHKVNAGSHFTAGNLTTGIQLHWVGATFWSRNALVDLTVPPGKVDSYALLNSRLAYTLRDRLPGVTLGVETFNLLEGQHYEILPALDDLFPGQHGWPVYRRVDLTVSYPF